MSNTLNVCIHTYIHTWYNILEACDLHDHAWVPADGAGSVAVAFYNPSDSEAHANLVSRRHELGSHPGRRLFAVIGGPRVSQAKGPFSWRGRLSCKAPLHSAKETGNLKIRTGVCYKLLSSLKVGPNEPNGPLVGPGDP